MRDGEAKEANFEDKWYLESLKLYWRSNLEDLESLQLPWIGSAEAIQENIEEAVLVMEILQPHPNLKELTMGNYGGLSFPYWMMNDGLDLLLPNLVMIKTWNCYRCQVLRPFGQLPSLKVLRLQTLHYVECMKDYPLSTKSIFPPLKTLMIDNVPNLRE